MVATLMFNVWLSMGYLFDIVPSKSQIVSVILIVTGSTQTLLISEGTGNKLKTLMSGISLNSSLNSGISCELLPLIPVRVNTREVCYYMHTGLCYL